MYKRLAATLASALILIAAPAKADQRIEFTASQFFGSSTEPAPTAITGAFEYFEDPTNFANPTLTKIELVIDGHTYSLSEVTLGATLSMVFLNSVANFDQGNNAFYLFTGANGHDFSFTSPARDAPWVAGSVEVTRLDVAAPVPEPETYGMLIAGLAMLGVVARRRKA